MIYQSPCQAAKAPYRLSSQPKIDSGEIARRDQVDASEVELHTIEFAENSVDLERFCELHWFRGYPLASAQEPVGRPASRRSSQQPCEFHHAS